MAGNNAHRNDIKEIINGIPIANMAAINAAIDADLSNGEPNDLFAGRQVLRNLMTKNDDFDAVVIAGNECAVVAYGKRFPVRYYPIKRIMTINDSFGCMFVGLISDIKKLKEKIREEIVYSEFYRYPSDVCIRLSQLSRNVLMYGYRSTAVGMIVIRMNQRSEVQATVIGPSATREDLTAKVYGPNSDKIGEYLFGCYRSNLNVKEAITLAVRSLNVPLNRKLNAGEIYVGVLTKASGTFKILYEKDVFPYLKAVVIRKPVEVKEECDYCDGKDPDRKRSRRDSDSDDDEEDTASKGNRTQRYGKWFQAPIVH